MLAITDSATLQGVVAVPVTVEANGGEKGEPRCVLVGLPDTAVKESLRSDSFQSWPTQDILDRELGLRLIWHPVI